MTRLVWNQEEDKRYELGVSAGVLYLDGSPGVAWNGLVSVNEVAEGANRNEYFVDGVRSAELLENTSYQATIQAYSAPSEFDRCLGVESVIKGFFLTNQGKERFGLSYKTLIGNIGYKIHLVYNATASPSNREYTTMTGSEASPTVLEWSIFAVPPPSTIFKPTAHYVIDSTKTNPSVLVTLENLLYGDHSTPASLPSLSTLIDMFSS